MQGTLDVGLLFRHFRWPVLVTWLLVLLENTLLALIPLFIGRAIDALLANEVGALWEVAAVMAALLLVASVRRTYDTRCYGTMRVRFGAEVVNRIGERPVSQVNARLDMSREMVDFLEAHVPELLTACVQIIVSIAILWTFGTQLGISALTVIVGIGVVYALFHRRFYRLNSDLNSQNRATGRGARTAQTYVVARAPHALAAVRSATVRYRSVFIRRYLRRHVCIRSDQFMVGGWHFSDYSGRDFRNFKLLLGACGVRHHDAGCSAAMVAT